MKPFSIKNIIPRFICWILLLQIINISIDPPDLKQWKKPLAFGQEDLSINEIESFYELVSEVVFEKNVPETEDNDIDTKSQSIDLYCFHPTYSLAPVFNFQIVHHAYYYNNFSSECSIPNSPPPKYA